MSKAATSNKTFSSFPLDRDVVASAVDACFSKKIGANLRLAARWIELIPLLCAREIADSRCPADMASSMYLHVSPIFRVTSRHAFDIRQVGLRQPCGNKPSGNLK